MNSAQIYKNALRKKKTYLIATIAAILFFFGIGGMGVYEGTRYVEPEPDPVHTVPYAEYFKKYAPEAGFDWMLLAAVANCESRYNPKAHSHGGAMGIMQLMPRTAKKYGLNDSTVYEPEDNIRAAAMSFGTLRRKFDFIPDSTERAKFVLASYNAGIAHIYDARKLAQKHGANANNWEATRHWVDMLKYEEYYTDSVVKYGRFQGDETIGYVNKVFRNYHRIQREEAELEAKLNHERSLPVAPTMPELPEQE